MTLSQALEIFGVPNHEAESVLAARTEEDLRVRWSRFLQQRVRGRYRKIAFETHPDRGGKPEEFLLAREAWDLLTHPIVPKRLWELKTVVRRPVRVTFTVATDMGNTSTTNTATGFGGTFYGGMPYYVWRSQ